MKNQSSMPSAEPWAQLAMFRIYKDVFPGQQPTAAVFNNTRQQCRVHILLVGLDNNNNEVQIPADDLDKIELIDYATGAPLTRVDKFDDHPDWAYSICDQGYVWDESKILGTAYDPEVSEQGSPTDDSVPANAFSSIQPNQQVVTYYVSTKSLSTRQIAARIPYKDTSFKTNSKVDDPDGRGNGSGSFNSHVEIRPVAFPSLPSDAYGEVSSAGTLLPNRVGSNSYFYWATEYFLHVKLRNELLKLKSVGAGVGDKTGFAVYKQGGPNDNAKWGISYYSQPGKSAPENFPLAPLASVDVVTRQHDENAPHITFYPMEMFKTCVGSIMNASETRVVVGLLTGNLASRLLDAGRKEVAAVNSTTLHIMDIYGNDHELGLSFGSKANELRITKR